MLTDRLPARPGRPKSTNRRTAFTASVLLIGALVGCSSSGDRTASPSDQVNAAAALPASCRDAASPGSTPSATSDGTTSENSTTSMAFAPSSITGGRDGAVPVAPARAHLTGRIIDGLCRTPIEGAALFFFSGIDSKAGPVADARTDAQGRFQVELARDRYRIAYNHAGSNYDFTWYQDRADFAGATEFPLRGDADLGDLELYHPEDTPVPPYEGEGTRRIAVIGDSLVQQSTTPIARKIDLIGPAAVRGLANQRIDQMQPTAERFAATDPDTVVIALGSNDANQNRSPWESLMAMERMLTTLDKTRCIVLLDLNTHTPNDAFNTIAGQLNTGFAKLAERHRQVHLAPWDATVAVMLEAAPMADWFTDGLHLTDRGIEVYARAMAEATANC